MNIHKDYILLREINEGFVWKSTAKVYENQKTWWILLVFVQVYMRSTATIID